MSLFSVTALKWMADFCLRKLKDLFKNKTQNRKLIHLITLKTQSFRNKCIQSTYEKYFKTPVTYFAPLWNQIILLSF